MANPLRSLWNRLTTPHRALEQSAQAERQRLLAAVAAQTVRQAALLRLSEELGAAVDEAEVCRRVVHGLRDTLGYDHIVLYLVEETSGDRVLATHTDRDQPPERLAPGQGLSEQPLLDGKLHYSSNAGQDPRHVPGLGGSEVDVPVRIGGKVRGVLIAERLRRNAFDQDDFEVLTAAAQQAGLAIEKARLLAAERRRADELDALRTTLADVTAELELPALLQAIVERATALLDATGGELGLYDETTQEIRILVCHNMGQDFTGVRLTLDQGAMGLVARTGEPIIIDDYPTWEGRAPQYDGADLHGGVTIPLTVGARLVGAITIADERPERRFSPADLHLLNLFGQQAAIAIENARLFGETERRVEELATLNDIGQALSSVLRVDQVLQLVYEQTRRVMFAENMIIMLYDEERDEIQCAFSRCPDDAVAGEPFPATGLTGHILKNRRPVLLATDVLDGVRALGLEVVGIPSASFLGVPMLRGEKVLGAIILQHYDAPYTYDQSDLALLETIANQAAMAIDNARLFEAEQRRGEQFRLIGEVGRRMTSILAADELLWEIARLVKGSLGYYLVGIALIEDGDLVFRAGAGGVWDTPGFHPPRLKVGQEGITGWVAHTGQPLLVPDLSQEPRHYDLPESSEVRSELAVPLTTKDRVIGVLHVQSQHLNAFDEGDLDVLQALGHQAAIAIDNARLYADLRASQEYARNIIDSSLDPIIAVDKERRIVEFNRAARETFGYEPEEILGRHVDLLYADHQVGRDAHETSLEQGGYTREVMNRRKSGQVFPALLSASPLHDAEGELVGVMGISRDITEVKQAEEELRRYQEHLEELVHDRTAELRASEERYRTLFDGVPIGLYRTTPDGRMLDANLALMQMERYASRKEMLTANLTDSYVDPQDRVRWQALMEQGGVVRDFEFRLRRHDGTVIWVNDSARAVRDDAGQLIYYEGSIEDITERKRAEQELRRYQEHLEELVEERTAELRASEERYRTLFDGVPVGLYRSTPEGRILDLNRAMMDQFRIPDLEAALALDTPDYYVDPADRARWQALIEQEGVVRDFEARVRRVDGTIMWISDSARAVKDEAGRVLHYEGNATDITERKRAEEELRLYQEHLEERVLERTADLRASEERYRTLFDGVPVGLYRSTPEGRMVDANLALVQMMGFPSREAVMEFPDAANVYADPQDRIRWQALMEREGVVRDFEARLQRADGSIIWTNDTARAVKDEHGQTLHYEGSLEDITQRKLAQLKLEESEEQYRTLYQATRDAVMLLHEEAFFDCNPAALQIFGCEARDEFVGKHPSEFSPEYQPDGRDSVSLSAERIETALREGTCFFEWQHQRLDGSEFPAEVLLSAMEIRERKVLQAVVRDITERKRAEEELRRYQEHLEDLVQERTAELRASEERYRTLFDGVPVGLYRTTPDGRTVDANQAMQDMFRARDRDELLRLPVDDFYVDLEGRRRWKEQIDQEGVVRDFEFQVRRLDGTVVWLSDTARAVKDEQGRVLHYEGSLEDVTQRKQLEEELRRQKDYFEALFVNNPVAVVTADLEGVVVSWNPMAEKLFGHSQEEAIGQHIDVLVANDPRVQDEALDYTHQVKEGGRVQATARRVHRDGSLLEVEVLAVPVIVGGERVGLLGIYHDISERKRFEEELRRQKDYFEALFVNSPVAIATVDAAVDVVGWNPTAERLFGYSEEEAIGRNLDDLVASDPRIREEALRYTEMVKTKGRVQAIARRTRKDGSLVDVEVLALPVVVAGEEVGSIAIYVDIGELQQARREAEAANQAKSLFLANMSHELRTPLNAILGFTQLMDGDPNLTAEQRENLAIIDRSGEHLLSLINDVLEMSKIEAGRVSLEERPFDLHALLDSLEEMFRLRAEERGLMFTVRGADAVPRYVVTDELKLRQVLGNLLGNAFKFTQEGGVALRVRSEEGEEAPSPDLGRRTILHFEVQDTGRGIAPEELDSIFDPFVQAAGGQQSQEGTGLGLAISRQYVQLMGGDIGVRSQVGQGSLFRFDVRLGLPEPGTAIEMPAQPALRVLGLAPGQAAPDGGPWRLLVVEDRETNRLLLVKLLEPLGFDIREAQNGQEAVDVWADWQPHLIWMDMRMPVMDGSEATRRIKAMPGGQETVVIALTATAFEEDREQILAEGCDGFVRKPFRKEEIYDLLAQHLGVQFIYEEEAAPAAPVPAPEAAVAADLAGLPASWLSDLERATVRADLGQMLALAEQIRDQHPALAATLDALLDSFAYNEVLALVEGAGGGR